MNYLKTYESYSNKEEILETISDILLDARDDGFDVEVVELTGTSSAWMSKMSGYKEYRILIKKTNNENPTQRHDYFNYEDVRNVMERALQYLKTNGIESSYIQVFNYALKSDITGRWCPIHKSDPTCGKRIKATKILFKLK